MVSWALLGDWDTVSAGAVCEFVAGVRSSPAVCADYVCAEGAVSFAFGHVVGVVFGHGFQSRVMSITPGRAEITTSSPSEMSVASRVSLARYFTSCAFVERTLERPRKR